MGDGTKHEPGTLVFAEPGLERGFVQLPRSILHNTDLTRDARLLYAVLLSYAWQSEQCFPGLETLCDTLGAAERSVRYWAKELVDAGLLEVVRRGQLGNLYRLHVTPKWQTTADLDPSEAAPTGNPLPSKHESEKPKRQKGTGLKRQKGTGEVYTGEYKGDTTYLHAPNGAAPTPQKLPVKNRAAEFIDACRALGVEPILNGRGGKALKDCTAPVEQVARAYCAVSTGAIGDDWLRSNLSVHAVVDRLPGLLIQLAGDAGPKGRQRHQRAYTAGYQPVAKRSDQL